VGTGRSLCSPPDSCTEVWRELRVCFDDLDPGDRRELLAGTTQRVYGLATRGVGGTR
jgi:hypothetical protein